MTISIRPVVTLEDCQAIERLHLDIWGAPDLDANPSHLLLVIAKEGGIVLLALDDHQPVGFSLGVLGLTRQNRLKIVSHMTGVLTPYQSAGLGYQLKLAQREAALARGIDLITWTFDPLQGRNAHLNLHKLGAVCNTYLRHLYGDMPDALNRGLPSDRFQVDWWLASANVTRRLTDPLSNLTSTNSSDPLINPTRISPEGFLSPPATFILPGLPRCWVQIPLDFPALRAGKPELALAWRLHTRAVFEAYFSAGYTAVDLVRGQESNFYLLQKDFGPQ